MSEKAKSVIKRALTVDHHSSAHIHIKVAVMHFFRPYLSVALPQKMEPGIVPVKYTANSIPV